MFNNIKKLFVCVGILASIFSINSFAEVKEVQTLDDFAAEVLKTKPKEKVKEKIQEKTRERIEETEKVSAREINRLEEELARKEIKKEIKKKSEKIEQIKKVEEKKVEKKNSEKKAIAEDNKIIKSKKELEKKVQKETKDLALEEPENLEKDNKKYEMTTYHSADGVEWELPDNFRSVVIGDLHGNIIFSKDGEKTFPLASVTKMMTLMVTFDEINAGRISLKDEVTISKNPIRYGGSGIPLKAGQVFVLEDLIKAAAIYSANNATYAIAEYVGGGSINKFVAKMNAKLKELGLQNEISYYTPAGLPTRVTKKPMDEGTAKGIYKLSIEALKYKKYLEIAGIEKTKIHNGKISIRNRNHLLGEQGIYGIKTGFHKEAKYNIAVASKYNGADVIIVVMGGETYKARDGVVLSVLENFHKNYTMKNGIARRK